MNNVPRNNVPPKKLRDEFQISRPPKRSSEGAKKKRIAKASVATERAERSSKKADPLKSKKPIEARVLINPSNTVVPEPVEQDIFKEVSAHLERKDFETLRKVSKSSEKLVPKPIITINERNLEYLASSTFKEGLNLTDLDQNEVLEKLKSIEKSKLKISFKIKGSTENIQKLIQFISDPQNKKFLKNIDSISLEKQDDEFKSYTYNNLVKLQHLFSIISENSDQLSSLTSINIYKAGGAFAILNIPDSLNSIFISKWNSTMPITFNGSSLERLISKEEKFENVKFNFGSKPVS